MESDSSDSWRLHCRALREQSANRMDPAGIEMKVNFTYFGDLLLTSLTPAPSPARRNSPYLKSKKRHTSWPCGRDGIQKQAINLPSRFQNLEERTKESTRTNLVILEDWMRKIVERKREVYQIQTSCRYTRNLAMKEHHHHCLFCS